jgi:hypothetical protein
MRRHAVPLLLAAALAAPARGSDTTVILGATVPADPAAGAAGPDLRARIYVKDLDHLARIVAVDPEVGPRARDLAARQKRAGRVTIGGFVVGTSLFAVGGALWMNDIDSDLDSETFGEQTSSRGPTMMAIGGVTLVATGIYLLTQISRGDDLIDLVNDWNVRHPAEPIEIVGFPASDHAHRAHH